MNDDYAIVVGINTYTKLPPLSSSVNDANAFAEWLRAPKGGGIINPAHLKLLMSPDEQQPDIPAEPIQVRIDTALESFGIGNGHIIGRRLYLYFSGHGIGIDFNDVAMLMANASHSALNSNIGLLPYLSFFRARELFEELVFIVDCCRDRIERKKISPMPPIFTLEEATPPPPVNDFVFLASADGEKAFAVPKNNGLMTQALLEGLQGEAADQTGKITSLTLYNYTTQRVKELAKNINLKQSPQLERVPARELIFCQIADRIKIKISPTVETTGRLLLKDGKFADLYQTDLSGINQQNPWEVELFYSRVPYMLLQVPSGNLMPLDLSRIKGNNYEFQF